MRWLFAPVLWLGRVLLWFVFLPIGIWRSIHHGRKKTERKILEAIDQQQMRVGLPQSFPTSTLPPPP